MWRHANAALARSTRKMRSRSEGAQIVEFALSLPLLVVFVVGIFDFSNAITLKQKLTNAATEGARVAAADPAGDLASPTNIPASVADAWQVVDNYLLAAKVNDCGLSGVTPTQGTGLVWTATSAGAGCPGSGITLTINRSGNGSNPACFGSATSGTTALVVVNSCVTLQYAYRWQFNSVSGLVGGSLIGPSTITSVATAFNEN
jgi:Flp pilus assembly protein TadG